MNILNTDADLRMATLESCGMLTDLPDPMFDNLLQIIASVSGASTIFISFFDKDKQYFKSKLGISVASISLENSICYQLISSAKTNEILEVVDLNKQEQFSSNVKLYALSNPITFYTVPIVNLQGIVVGSIGMFNPFETKLGTQEQKEVLKNVSQQVSYLLELKKTQDLVKVQDKEKKLGLEGFTNIAVHDLKAPIRSIKSFLQLIEAKNKSNQDEKEAKYFKFIFDNVKILEDLIADLAQYVKIDCITTEEEDLDLNELVTTIYNDFNFSDSKTIDFQCDKLPMVKGFRFEWHAVFYNLIENALKYNTYEEILQLKISYKENPDHHIFEVADNGIGISEDFFEMIFKPFKRLHTKTEYPGSGLGLAIVEKIIQINNGTLQVESQLNKGSKFIFTIPKKRM